MSVAVPANYQLWVQQAAAGTGLPETVVAAQINDESGFNPNATSSTGAEGIAQFEPGTWAGLGVPGSPYNPQDALQGYVKEMSELLAQFHGNVRDALAAYNAGAGNLAAGYGYADVILSAAGHDGTLSVSNPGAGAPSGSTGLTSSLSGVFSGLGNAPGLAGMAVLAGGVLLLALGLWVGGVAL